LGFILPAVLVIVSDQVTKQLFWHLGKNFDVLDGILKITLVKNTGAAFGLFQGGRLFFITASIVASILIAYLGFRIPREESGKRLLMGVILGGAVGNLIDRIYAGDVIDFIDMGIADYRWPVYNVADMAVTVGVVILILAYIRSRMRSRSISTEQVGAVHTDECSDERDGA
jgi:signal peptidase II